MFPPKSRIVASGGSCQRETKLYSPSSKISEKTRKSELRRRSQIGSVTPATRTGNCFKNRGGGVPGPSGVPPRSQTALAMSMAEPYIRRLLQRFRAKLYQREGVIMVSSACSSLLSVKSAADERPLIGWRLRHAGKVFPARCE